MDYYFNELSALNLPQEQGQILEIANTFAKTCIGAKKFGFKSLRSDIYFSQIVIGPNDYKFGDWMKDRHSGDLELKRKFKSLNTATPLFSFDEDIADAFDGSDFKVNGRRATGFHVAFLKKSIAVSFLTEELWGITELAASYDYLQSVNNEILCENVMVKNASLVGHWETHWDYIYEQLIRAQISLNWNPMQEYLPNRVQTNELLSIEDFYDNLSRFQAGDRISRIRRIGKQVAELNFYKFNKEVSRRNRNDARLRDIYESRNSSGNKVFLSVDFEKGAFEVCDFRGSHLCEILFDGTLNGGPQDDHSIIVN